MPTELEAAILSPLQLIAQESQQRPWDAIIVGGGTAGCVAARTLIEKGLRVAILESGPLLLLTHSTTCDVRFDPALSNAIRDSVRYGPRTTGGEPFGRLFGCVGGRSLFWNGASPRYRSSDFSAWPITYEDLEDAYRWAETDFRVSRDYGSKRLTDQICSALRGQALEGEPGPFAIDTHPTSDGWISGTIANAVSGLLRTGFLGNAGRRLRLGARSFVSRIILDRATRKVRGVVVIDRETGNPYEVAARSVVLAAGAHESTRLAMWSSIPDDSGRLGHYITDHLFCRAYYLVPPETYDAKRPEAAIVFVPASASNRYQVEIHLPGNMLFLQQSETKWNPAATNEYAAMVRSFGAVEARHENYLGLTGADTPGGYTVHFSYSDGDLKLRESMLAAMNKARLALKAPALDPTLLPPGSSYHEAGGLMMGASPKTSVTDPFGRFHAVANLVAVDAATWPVAAAANPHLTIAALSRRQASQLATELSKT